MQSTSSEPDHEHDTSPISKEDLCVLLLC